MAYVNSQQEREMACRESAVLDGETAAKCKGRLSAGQPAASTPNFQLPTPNSQLPTPNSQRCRRADRPVGSSAVALAAAWSSAVRVWELVVGSWEFTISRVQ